MPNDLDALAALAREATAGPWKPRLGTGVRSDEVVNIAECDGAELEADGDELTFAQCEANAAYIAAANPAVVLGLIERVQRAEAKLEAIRDECDGKEDADDGIPNTAMRCMMIVEGTDKP